MKVLVFLGVLGAGCVGPSVPRLHPTADPPTLSDRLVAMSTEGSRAVVVRESAEGIDLVHLDFDNAQSRRLVAVGDADRSAIGRADSRRELVAAVFSSSARTVLETTGFEPAEPLEAEALSLPSGLLRLRGDRLVLEDKAGERVTLRSLGAQRRPDAILWLASPSRTRVAAELVYSDGPVETRTVWIFTLDRIEAERISNVAFGLFRDRKFREAAKQWREALRLYPNHGTSRYNLACAEARMGDTRAALRHLQLAIAIDRHRFRALAKVDPDLATVRDRPVFHRLIFGGH